MRLFSVLLIVATALAGCASDAPPVDDGFNSKIDEDLEATSTTGVIRGVVVDVSIAPLADALVELAGTEREARTDETGAFGFDELEPGTYFLKVSKPGYNATQSSAAVEAGVDKPEIVRVQLVQDFGAIPHVVELVFDGFIECGAWVAVCGIVSPSGSNHFLERYEIEGPPMFLSSELDWTSNQALSDELLFEGNDYSDGSWGLMWNPTGPSPIQETLNAEQIAEYSLGTERDLQLRVFSPLGSVVIDQPFTVYTHFFYGYAPAEGWQFTVDGAVPPP